MYIGSSGLRIGELMFGIGKFDEAEKHLLEALALTEGSGSKRRMSYIVQALARCYESMGDYEKATDHYNRFGVLYKEWVNDNNIKKIASLEKEFQFDRERETTALVIEAEKAKSNYLKLGLLGIGLILGIILWAFFNNRKAKQKIDEQNKLLSIGLEEKEILLKEVHHRVKNNLQVMSGLLQLQSNTSDNDELKKILHQSRNRIYSIAIIHELLYKDKEIREIDAEDYLMQIINLNSSIQEREAAVTVDAHGIKLSMDQAIPLGLIVNELTLNSYKHGFKTGANPEINVELVRGDTKSELSYRDNGVGDSSGSEIDTSKSLGLRLVKMMCKQLAGEHKFNLDEGFKYALRF